MTKFRRDKCTVKYLKNNLNIKEVVETDIDPSYFQDGGNKLTCLDDNIDEMKLNSLEEEKVKE